MSHRLLQDEIQKTASLNFDEDSGPVGCDAMSLDEQFVTFEGLLSCETVGTSHSMTHYHITVDLNIQQHWCENLISFVQQWC